MKPQVWNGKAVRYPGRDEVLPVSANLLETKLLEALDEWGVPEDLAKTVASNYSSGLLRANRRDVSLLFDPEAARFGRFFQSDPPPRRYILHDVLPLGVTGLLGAQGGAGKSLLAYQLAFAVTTGTPFLDMEVSEPGGFLYVASEDDEAELHRRGRRLLEYYQEDAELRGQSFDPGMVSERLYIVSRVGKDNLLTHSGADGEVHQTETLDRLIEAAQRIEDLRCIVLDPLSRFRGGNGNAEEDATRFVEAMEALKEATGATVLGLAHISKSGITEGGGQEILRGSSALVDGVRWAATLQRLPRSQATKYQMSESEAVNYLRLEVPKSNYTAPFPGMWLRRTYGGVLVPTPDPDPGKQDAHDQVVWYVRRNPGCSTNDVKRGVGGRAREVGEVILEPIGLGELVDDGGPSGRKLRCAGGGGVSESRKSLSYLTGNHFDPGHPPRTADQGVIHETP